LLTEVDMYSTNPNVVKLLLAHKIDKDERVIKREEAEKFAAENGLLYAEASSKSNIGVDEAFELIVRKVCDGVSVETGEETLNTLVWTDFGESKLGQC